MNCKTQMMKIGSPELFYLFRRAFGLFVLLTGISSFCHISTPPIDDSINNTIESTVHVSIGTFVYNSESTENPKSEKDLSPKRKIVYKRKKIVPKVISSSKKASNYFSKYHYTPLDNEESLRSIALQKNLFTYTNNHIKKKVELPEFWKIILVIESYQLTHYHCQISNFIQSHFQNYHVRPPPYA